MDALTALHTRVSTPRVAGPVPAEAALQNIFRAALRAPDHGQLRPWRFLRIQGEGLVHLADLFAEAAKADDPQISADKLESVRGKALRAPLVIMTISCATEHPKIPLLEQDIAAGCATHAMLVAAHAQGIGAVWRTGPMSTHPVVTKGLGLGAHEKVLAMLYIGQIEGPSRPIRELAVEDFVTLWS
jgi:nitroreductase